MVHLLGLSGSAKYRVANGHIQRDITHMNIEHPTFMSEKDIKETVQPTEPQLTLSSSYR